MITPIYVKKAIQKSPTGYFDQPPFYIKKSSLYFIACHFYTTLVPLVANMSLPEELLCITFSLPPHEIIHIIPRISTHWKNIITSAPGGCRQPLCP